MKISDRIKERCTCLGISQTELANKIGVSKQNLYKYENDIILNIPRDKIQISLSPPHEKALKLLKTQ